jgi:hypothetical protein
MVDHRFFLDDLPRLNLSRGKLLIHVHLPISIGLLEPITIRKVRVHP